MRSVSFLPRDARSAERGIVIVSCQSVCQSVRPSVSLRYRKRIGWTSKKLITRIISLGSSLLGSHNVCNLVQGKHPKILWRVALLSRKPALSLKEARYDQGYYWWSIGSRIRAFDWCQNQRPWMTLKGHYALCFKPHVSFGAHHTRKCE